MKPRNLGRVCLAPFDVHLSSRDIVEPDRMFVSAGHLGIIQDWLRGAPDLAVEMPPPAHEERDRSVKRDLYAKYVVPESWIADPTARALEVRSREGREWKWIGEFGTADELRSPLLPEFRPAVRESFE